MSGRVYARFIDGPRDGEWVLVLLGYKIQSVGPDGHYVRRRGTPPRFQWRSR